MKSSKNYREHFKNKSVVRKSLMITALLFSISSGVLFAQDETSFGIKGGLNYNANGDYFESIGANAQDPDRNIGYHVGVFGKIGTQLYFRPELIYTSTTSDYNSADFNMKKIDAPLLIGIKVIGPVSVFGGPALQYILNSEFDGITIENVNNDFSVGLNFGIGLNLGKIGIDLRYERGFSDNEATFLGNNAINTSRLDTRPSQLIMGLSVAL